jgi:hypothetical protein
MSTLSHSLQLVHGRRIKLAQFDAASETAAREEFHIPEDDGLGCARGFAVAMLCNILLALVIAAGWELWRLLR